MVDDMRREIQERMGVLPSVGCELVIKLTPARRREIADRLQPALDNTLPQASVVTEFHRTTDGGIDLYFHEIETNQDRVDTERLIEFGERFGDIADQLTLERAQEESPELFEEFGRDMVIKILGDSNQDSLLTLVARPTEDVATEVEGEVLLELRLDRNIPEEQFESTIARGFMGQLIRAEKQGERRYLIGGEPTTNVSSVEEALETVENELGFEVSDSNVVCRVREAT